MNKQNPFSLYDFLGYIIPGSLSIYTYLVVDFLNNNSIKSLANFINEISKNNFEGIFVFIIFAYTLGHLLSFISSITIEKYGNWKYGYPSKYLIGYKPSEYWKNPKEVIFILKIKSNFWRLSLAIILLPITFMDYLLGNLLGFKKYYQSNLDEFLIKSIKFKVDKLIKKLSLNNPKVIEDFNAREHDFHRIVHHYAFENCKQHQFRMVNYVALYGFLRNIALIFNFLAWLYTYYLLKSINIGNQIDYSKLSILFSLMILSYIGFMAFMKFYRRYTLEGFMLIVVDENLK